MNFKEAKVLSRSTRCRFALAVITESVGLDYLVNERGEEIDKSGDVRPNDDSLAQVVCLKAPFTSEAPLCPVISGGSCLKPD